MNVLSFQGLKCLGRPRCLWSWCPTTSFQASPSHTETSASTSALTMAPSPCHLGEVVLRIKVYVCMYVFGFFAACVNVCMKFVGFPSTRQRPSTYSWTRFESILVWPSSLSYSLRMCMYVCCRPQRSCSEIPWSWTVLKKRLWSQRCHVWSHRDENTAHMYIHTCIRGKLIYM